MSKTKAALGGSAVALLLAALSTSGAVSPRSSAPASEVSARRYVAVVGNPARLKAAYARWRSDVLARGDESVVTLGLGWSKGRSTERTSAHGRARIDLAAEEIEVVVDGLEPGADLSAWLVAYRPGRAGDAASELLLGRLEERSGTWSLARSLAGGASDFEVDLVVVTRAGTSPADGGLLYGSPNLFQRLLSLEARGARSSTLPRGLLLGVAGPMPVPLQGPIPPTSCIDQLVAEGEDLFFNETFGGNGRTCGTCHPAENNLTIDPPFIAKLKKDDPLFVAEFVPELDSELNGGLVFEQPELMREFGLIVENVDGFEDPATKFVMRGVPHVFAQGISIGLSGTATGWSGDGVTDQGGNPLPLREFATGAVKQHFTLTMDRMPFMDFQPPTADQLNKIEAFMLSLGRQEELDLAAMDFTLLAVRKGRDFFRRSIDDLGEVVFGCAACHENAGANEGATNDNENFDTGVEEFLVNHGDGDTPERPLDGGFGRQSTPEGFGNGEFNTPSVVELADTLPAFHNNLTNSTFDAMALEDTVEGAIEFYRSAEFIAEFGDLFRDATDPDKEVVRLGKFLRVLNALENERQIRERAELARCLLDWTPVDEERVDRALAIAVADATDAVEVLQAVDIHKPAQVLFRRARGKLAGAKAGTVAARQAKIDAALVLLTDARAEMINE